jgi:hypothetical protein
VVPTVSFVSEIFVDDHYADDGLRFATKGEALAYGEARAYGAFRATLSEEPVNYSWCGGKLTRVEPAFAPLYVK